MTEESWTEFAMPVTIKGVVIVEGRVALLRNHRGEWELPGGRLERGETPRMCVEREIREELGWTVSAERLVDAYAFDPVPGRTVFVVAFGCELLDTTAPTLSDEHVDIAMLTLDDLTTATIPAGYVHAIEEWFAVGQKS